MWQGYLRHRNETALNLKLTDSPTYALGVHFSYNEEITVEEKDKLNELKHLLNVWSSRDISLYERIKIIKILSLCSMVDTPKECIFQVNETIFVIYGNKTK